jgi:hypothetical protein
MFDTWVLNRDRHFPDPAVRKPNHANVFLAYLDGTPARLGLVAMDHTHCFDNGQIHRRLSQIGFVKDERIYGLFAAFVPHLQPLSADAIAERLKRLTREQVESMIEEVPAAWQVDEAAAEAWADLLIGRAAFVAEHLPGRLAAERARGR